MKALDFDFSKDLKFDLKTGITSFKDNRLVIFDANAVGLLRQSMVSELGSDIARKLFLRFGFLNGYSDFMQMKLNYQFDSDMDLLASGPVIHTWEGIVQATPKEIRFDRAKGEFYFSGIWTNSYEAEHYLSFNDFAKEPVCWSLMGYASGWCSAFFGSKLIAIEPVCKGKGDDHCEWLIKPPSDWDSTAAPYIEAYKDIV